MAFPAIPPLIAAASRLPRAAKLAKKVLGTNRTGRNQQIINDELIKRGIHQGIRTPINELDRMLPGGFEKFSKTVLAKSRPGGLVETARAIDMINRPGIGLGIGAGAAILGGGAFALSQTDPNDLGREMARMDMTLQEGFNTVRQKASDLAQIPQVYFMQVEQAYKDEMQRQQEMQNIQEFGNPMGEPATPTPAVREILGESGRTLSNKELQMLSPRDRAKAIEMGLSQGPQKDEITRLLDDISIQ